MQNIGHAQWTNRTKIVDNGITGTLVVWHWPHCQGHWRAPGLSLTSSATPEEIVHWIFPHNHFSHCTHIKIPSCFCWSKVKCRFVPPTHSLLHLGLDTCIEARDPRGPRGLKKIEWTNKKTRHAISAVARLSLGMNIEGAVSWLLHFLSLSWKWMLLCYLNILT